MRSWKTTAAGAIAALSLAASVGLGLGPSWDRLLVLLCAVALGALGYHAGDCAQCPGRAARIAAGLTVGLTVLLLVGCTLSSFTLGVKSPAFGEVQIGIGGGAMGKGVSGSLPGTNDVPPVILTPTNGILTNLVKNL